MTRALPFDPALARRDELLDADAVAHRIGARFPAAGICGGALRRAKYRVGRDLRVLYSLTTGDDDLLVSMRTMAPRGSDDRRLRGGLPAGFRDDELGASFWTFPHDRRVDGAPRVMDPDAELRGAVTGWVRSELVHYVPEESVVVRALDRRGHVRAYAKAYADDRGSSTAAALRAAAGAVDVPAVIGEFDRARIVVVEPVVGTALEHGSPTERSEAAAAFGAVVAALHASAIPDVPTSTRDELDAARTAADLVIWARPDLAARVGAVVDTLAARASDDVGDDVVVMHGDLKLTNAVRTATGVALIDLDAVARGPAAADLGHCCARILSDAIRRGRPRSDADALVDAIANGYATRRPLPSPAALAWHTAASLLARRAGRVVTAAKLDELVHLDAIVDLAAATVL